MAPTGAAKKGAAKVRPKKEKAVSTGLFSQMVSIFTQISCHFW